MASHDNPINQMVDAARNNAGWILILYRTDGRFETAEKVYYAPKIEIAKTIPYTYIPQAIYLLHINNGTGKPHLSPQHWA